MGLMFVGRSEFAWFWFAGSVFSDIDHIVVLARHKIFGWRKIIDAMKFEDKYGFRFKTKYVHSLFGALLFSAAVALLSIEGAGWFFAAYVLHLLLDWPDRDIKQYFYPFKTEIRGFLPIFSLPEKIFTLVLLFVLVFVLQLSH